MKKILFFYLALSAYSLQAQMHLGAASFLCKDCNAQGQGQSFASMLGMVYNGAWPSSTGDVVAIHYFLPFISGKLASPIYEFGEQNGSIAVFPNPTSDFIFLRGEEHLQNPISIRLTSAIGQIAIEKKWKPQGNILRLDVGQLPSGFYALTLNERNYFASHIIQIIH